MIDIQLTDPVITFMLPELQVPVMGVTLWAEVYWMSWPNAGTASSKSKEVNIMKKIG